MDNALIIVRDKTWRNTDIGAVMMNPERTSWQFELYDGSGTCIDSWDQASDALKAMFSYLSRREEP